jgi:hypothetical protein
MRSTKYGIQPMPHSTSTNLSFGWRARMPVKTSVETVSQIDIGAMAMNVSLMPGVGFWNVAWTLALRGPTMWKLIGRPVSSISDQNGS